MTGAKVWRPTQGRLVVSMPFTKGNRAWLKRELGARIRPEYIGRGKWTLARSHLDAVVAALADRFGRVDVFLDFAETQRCDVRCQSARSRECDCTCLGRNHGQGGITHGWKLVGDATLVLTGGKKRRHIVVTRKGEEV